MRTVCLNVSLQTADSFASNYTQAQRQMATIIYCNKYPHKTAGQVIFDIAEKCQEATSPVAS